MKTICQRVGMTRQNYYARRKAKRQAQACTELVQECVLRERRVLPRVGGRKLHHVLQNELREVGVDLGRDRFFDVLRACGLLVKPRRRRAKTTNSHHSLPVFLNLFKDLKLTVPNQAWVSDLTYLCTEKGFMYAALITDAYSRKIVGYHIGDTLEADGCLAALEMALQELPEGAYPMHHSDRGTQYCCHRYVNRLRARGLSISMTQENHCYENALAERVNGILKDEFFLDGVFAGKRQAVQAFHQAVKIYNTVRPHQSLRYAIPQQVHQGPQVQPKAPSSNPGGSSALAFGPPGHPCGDRLQAELPPGRRSPTLAGIHLPAPSPPHLRDFENPQHPNRLSEKTQKL